MTTKHEESVHTQVLMVALELAMNRIGEAATAKVLHDALSCDASCTAKVTPQDILELLCAYALEHSDVSNARERTDALAAAFALRGRA